MKLLALVPARGGSKRLPGKNVKSLGGKPLIAWTIEAALASRVCVDVMLSTDDPEIAAVGAHYGAWVPGLRPECLATDTASSVDVALNALETYESLNGEVEGLILLQPTSPFRKAETICRAVELFSADEGVRPVVSFGPSPCHPAWCFRIHPGGVDPFLGWNAIRGRSQDLEPAWVLNGAVYVISPARLRAARSFLASDVTPCLMEDAVESIDIDTPTDWAMAEAVLRQ